MTPLQFAKEQCANYRSDGGCDGIGVKGDGSVFMFGAKPKCVLAVNQRCVYFEECVLPMGFEDPKLRQIRQDVEKDYRRSTGAHKVGGQTGRICPQCQVRELEPRRRLCYQCAAENLKQAKHAHRKANQGSNGGS